MGVNIYIYVNYECGVFEFWIEFLVSVVVLFGIDLYWFLIGDGYFM